jgi:excisionase family DNA binding protein
MKPVFVNMTTAARLLAISRSKAYELVASVELPAARIGASLRIPVVAIERRAEQAMAGEKPGAQ